MAEKKTSVKYKFGQKELDMDKYLKNVGHNVQSYLEDRRKHGWTDDQVQEFSTAYNRYMDAFKLSLTDNDNRFSTDDLGNITDVRGEFSNIDNDDNNGTQYYYNDKGERITNTDYDALKDKKKKKYKTFNANRQVAEYFRTIGKAMESAKPAEDEKFDLSKHGFVAWWNQKYNPAGGSVNLKPFLDKDPLGADGKRPVSNRAKMAAGWMNEYLDWLKDKNLDYSKYEQFGDYDTYSAKGRELAQKWNDGVWDADDLIAGQAFGISNDFSEGFFTTEEDPNLTPEQREAKNAEAAQKEEEAKAEQVKKDKQAWIDAQIAAFNNSNSPFTTDNPYTSVADSSYLYNADGSLNEENYYKAWGTNFIDPNTNRLNTNALNQYMLDFVQNPFGAQYKDDFARNIAGLIYHNIAQPIASGKYQGMYYIPSKSDEGVNRALVYDPSSKQMFYVFIGDIPSQWEIRRNKYDVEHGITKPNETYMWKQGGVIEMQFGGNFGEQFQQGRDSFIKGRADANGLTTEEYMARNRKALGEKNALETNNGWNRYDTARLTATAGDIAAMIASLTPVPGATVVGASVGAASTTGHLLADLEDGFDAGDVGRAALGYGLDALSLIPGVGAVSKGAKIAKTVAKYAPKLMAAVGAAHALTNAPEIMSSIGKVSDPSKMTVQDWQNVAEAITLATAGTAAGARKINTMRGAKGTLAKGPEGTTNSVALQVKNKKTGNVETRTFNADQAKAIRQAKNNEEIASAAKLGKEEELVTTTSMRPHLQWIRENGKWRSPIHTVQNKAEIMPIRLGNNGKYYAKRGAFDPDIAIENTASRIQTQLNDFRANTGVTKSVAELRAIQKKLGKTQADYTEKVKTINAELSKLKSAKTPDRKLIRSKQKELKDARDAVRALHKQVSPNASWMNLNFKNKEKKLEEYINSIKGLETQLGQANKNWSELVSGTNTSTGVKEAFKNIIREYGSYKEGGKFENIRKFDFGGSVRNVQGNADWFRDMYNHQSMTNWLAKWNPQNYEDFNKLQDSWFNNLRATGYDPTNPSQAMGEGEAKSMGVYNRQAEWNKTGTNAAIRDLTAKGILKGNGGTNDKAEAYQDGYFGAQEYLRHGGTGDSWAGHDTELQAQREAFKKKGLEYYQDENGMYKLRPLSQGETPQNVENPQNPNNKSSVTEVIGNGDKQEKQLTNNTIQQGLSDIGTDVASVGHLLYLNNINRIMANRSKSVRPTIYDPKHNYKYVRGNFDALMSGEKAAGDMMHLASQPLTSDGRVQTAGYLDAVNKALDYFRQGREAWNQEFVKRQDELWKLIYDDDAFNYDVAMKNRATLDDKFENDINIENALDAKNTANWETLWQQYMMKNKQKENKREALEERFALSDIHNAVTYNPNGYNAGLSDDELSLWNLIQSGDKKFSDLNSDQQAAYMKAQRKVSEAEQNQLRGYYGIPQSKYFGVRQIASGSSWKPSLIGSSKRGGVLQAKDGAAKIAVAKIRERSKDADRFYKNTKDRHDRVDKAIARVDKKMYRRRDPEKRRK